MLHRNYKIRNHPQQVKARGADDTTDERITPHDLYVGFDVRFNFTLDAAANAKNRKTEKFFDLERNALRQPWSLERVWCNPPWSNLAAWVYKAQQEFDRECEAIVMLLPCNRTEQDWWQRFIEPCRDRADSFLRTEFIARRRNFGIPGNEAGDFPTSPGFGLVAVIWDRQKR